MSLSRRQWLEAAGLTAVGTSLPFASPAEAAALDEVPAPIAALKPMSDGTLLPVFSADSVLIDAISCRA